MTQPYLEKTAESYIQDVLLTPKTARGIYDDQKSSIMSESHHHIYLKDENIDK
jgi:hypothetical protein